jgi:nitrate/TMAO reductase-like tetraheme cytochrome c subunit
MVFKRMGRTVYSDCEDCHIVKDCTHYAVINFEDKNLMTNSDTFMAEKLVRHRQSDNPYTVAYLCLECAVLRGI